jgi:hypothetical protein
VGCLGVVICQNQDVWLLSEVEVQDLRIYRMWLLRITTQVITDVIIKLSSMLKPVT